MRDTIQERHYSHKQAALRQLRPSVIIDTAKSVYPHCSPLIGISATARAVNKSMTSATRVMLVDVGAATSAVWIVRANEDYADLWNCWPETAKVALQRPDINVRSTPSAAGRFRVDRLTTIQATLGLSTQDFAQVLRLSRPGLYKWFDASKDVKLHETSRERLAVVERIAKHWRERSVIPLRSVANEPLAGGQTALSMLIAPDINEALIVEAFDEILEKVRSKPKSRSQRLADAGFTRRPSAQALPAED